ncbi:MAG: hypothetical protein ACJASL_003454, partial [Paraglaciecola sp.]
VKNNTDLARMLNVRLRIVNEWANRCFEGYEDIVGQCCKYGTAL